MLLEIFTIIMKLDFDLIKNITLLIFSVLGSLWLIFVPFRIWFIGKKIDKINDKIELKREKLNQIEIERIEPLENLPWLRNGGFFLKEKEYREIEQEIEKLEREKKNLLEKISFYKIFKK